jgi:hypothetical protein
LARQDKASGTRASELHEAGRDKLASSSLGVNQGPYWLSEVGNLRRQIGVVSVPGLEQVDDATAMRIVGFDGFDPFDRIATAERQEWIAAPFAPFFEAAERPTGFKVCGALPSPASDGQGCDQQVGSTKFDRLRNRRKGMSEMSP